MGRVVYQSTCRAQTRVVTTMREFLQQFTRWERNITQAPFQRIDGIQGIPAVYWLSAVDVFLRLGFGGLLTVGVIHDPFVALKIFLSFYIAFVLVLLKVKPAGSWLELPMTGALL